MKTIEELNELILSAAYRGQSKLLKDLIDQGAEVNAKDKDNETPLHWASYKSHTESVLFLISAGADINAESNFGNTALHLSAIQKNTEVALALIFAGANVDVLNKNNRTPLYTASINGREEAALALISHGADVSQTNEKFRELRRLTMHQAAAQGGFTGRMLELLREHPSVLLQDAPEALAALSKLHGKHETAAAIQSFIASQAIESMMNGASPNEASPRV